MNTGKAIDIGCRRGTHECRHANQQRDGLFFSRTLSVVDAVSRRPDGNMGAICDPEDILFPNGQHVFIFYAVQGSMVQVNQS